MIDILHVCSECYPAAKAGGMGDVVGSLPIYLPSVGVRASVIIPKYRNKWFVENSFQFISKGKFKFGTETISYTVEKLVSTNLGFPFYCIDIPSKFDRPQIYLGEDGNAFPDEPQRNLSFQIAVLEWLKKGTNKFDGIHCHDHMTGLITFMVKYCKRYESLKSLPTFFTIHNGQYRGIWDWSMEAYFPPFAKKYKGLLDWDDEINCLAAAIKCAWQVNTVSPSYMLELQDDLGSLTSLIKDEKAKCSGILNGIDNKVWDPSSDEHLDIHLKKEDWNKFKKHNKATLCEEFGLSGDKALIGFIGRFAYEKGADLLAPSISQYLKKENDIEFIILGSGDKSIEQDVTELSKQYVDNVACTIAYNEKLARKIYASCDFLIMPSRFEPCGLNQMFSMRYGTIPIVRSIGGLKDTVPDIQQDGNGIAFQDATIIDILTAMMRAAKLYLNKKKFKALRKKIVELDYSWDASAKAYAAKYQSLI